MKSDEKPNHTMIVEPNKANFDKSGLEENACSANIRNEVIVAAAEYLLKMHFLLNLIYQILLC